MLEQLAPAPSDEPPQSQKATIRQNVTRSGPELCTSIVRDPSHASPDFAIRPLSDEHLRSTLGRVQDALKTAIVLLLTFVSCSLFQPALQSPAKSGVVWREITSEHFVLYTDLVLDEARVRVQEFETLRDALAKVAFDVEGAQEPRVSTYCSIATRTSSSSHRPVSPDSRAQTWASISNATLRWCSRRVPATKHGRRSSTKRPRADAPRLREFADMAQ
jgi:hypothetical protein